MCYIQTQPFIELRIVKDEVVSKPNVLYIISYTITRILKY